MPVDDKTLSRISKLLKLAAPSSNTTVAERESAALEAARLIAEFDVSIGESAEIPTEPKHVSQNTWMRSVALQFCSCSYCNKQISRGDVVWIKVRPSLDVEYRHNYAPCAVI
jgi:hypothetical protein